jgi:hypothetical protein
MCVEFVVVFQRMRKEDNAEKVKANKNSPNRGLDGSPGHGATDRNAVMQVSVEYEHFSTENLSTVPRKRQWGSCGELTRERRPRAGC